MGEGASSEMAARNHERALTLAGRYPAAKEALEFYARICDYRGPAGELFPLVPAELAHALVGLDAEAAIAAYLSGADRHSPASFFARLHLRQAPPPDLTLPPQCGVLRPEGHGSALTLVCPITQAERPARRGACPACGSEDLAFYQNDALPHVSTQACEACRGYLHLIDLGVDPEAVPEADEIAALPLDVWAAGQGYAKLHPNLVGI